jgi:uncharacterized NAD(P)/FAD-binding protein YdhS
VLALGALSPQPLNGVGDDVLESGRYLVDPWQLLRDATTIDPPPRKVALIGMGLTAIDVLLELSALWPQTEFTAISRHGKLPEAHQLAAGAPADDSAELIEAMRETPEIRSWMHLLREAMSQEGDWRTVLDSLRPHTPSLWRALPLEQRSRFMRHARWAWERARHRMPPQVHEKIDMLEREGRLHRQRGRMRTVALSGDGLTMTLEHAGHARSIDADMVVQTIGLNTDVRRTDHRLVGQLLTNAHITPDPLGLGVGALPDGRLQHDGTHWTRLFAIGSLLRGTLWESTAMPEIRQQARSLADQLLAG